MRPPVRAAADRLSLGSAVLAGQFGAWLVGDGARAVTVRLLGTGTGGAVAVIVLDRAPALTAVATAGWCYAAWRTSATPAPAEEDAPDDGPGEEQLLAALHAVADPHAHLSAVAVRLGVDTGVVRELLAAAGIPVAPGVRMRDRGVSTGVRRADIPPLPCPTPSGPSRVGDQQQQQQQQVVERPQEGLLIIRDPAETAARHHPTRHP